MSAAKAFARLNGKKKGLTVTLSPEAAEKLQKAYDREQERQEKRREFTDNLGIHHIYHEDDARAIAHIPCRFSLMNGYFELFKVLSYSDGWDKPEELSKQQIESFVRHAVEEKIERCLQDYAKLGEITSRMLQRKYNKLVTLKEAPRNDWVPGLVPLEYGERKGDGSVVGF